MKSPIPYFGGKSNLAQTIVGLMPAHVGYVEPYCGSLAVLLEKAPSKLEVVNDLDANIMTFWRVLREQPEQLIRAAALTPHGRQELEQAKRLDGLTDLELARQVWVLLTQGRSRTLKRTGWRHFADATRASGSFSVYMDAYRDRLEPAMKRLLDVSLECRPAEEVIEKYGAVSSNLLYVDPPYLAATRRAGRYVHEMGTDDAHRSMSALLRACEAKVMLSGYSSALYDQELFSDWDRVEIPTTSANAKDQGRTEVIWANFEMERNMLDWKAFA